MLSISVIKINLHSEGTKFLCAIIVRIIIVTIIKMNIVIITIFIIKMNLVIITVFIIKMNLHCACTNTCSENSCAMFPDEHQGTQVCHLVSIMMMLMLKMKMMLEVIVKIKVSMTMIMVITRGPRFVTWSAS